jgi:hypothetical protein
MLAASTAQSCNAVVAAAPQHTSRGRCREGAAGLNVAPSRIQQKELESKSSDGRKKDLQSLTSQFLTPSSSCCSIAAHLLSASTIAPGLPPCRRRQVERHVTTFSAQSHRATTGAGPRPQSRRADRAGKGAPLQALLRPGFGGAPRRRGPKRPTLQPREHARMSHIYCDC